MYVCNSHGLHDHQAVHDAYHDMQRILADSTLVSQLYFPDEHKFAVYIPFFVPILYTIIRGFVSEFKAMRKRSVGGDQACHDEKKDN